MEVYGFSEAETRGTGKHETTIRDRDKDCAIWPHRDLATHRSPQGELQSVVLWVFFRRRRTAAYLKGKGKT